LDNLVGLCRICHGEETETLAQGGMARGYRAYYSQLSPRIANLFMRQVRMPKAWIHGRGAYDPFEEEVKQIHCLDLRGCRRNALFTTERLPVFGPGDEEEQFNPLCPSFRFDYYWVKEGDASESVYQGPNLYFGEVVKYMLAQA
jgi:hypothetical protein